MLYMSGPELKIIILETANLEELKKGRPAVSPDKSVLIAWTPDPTWLAEEIAKTDGDGEVIAKLIDQAAKRPEKPLRPYHPPEETTFVKKEL
jgi:hypothetical protein